jgi:hypothetical protein
MFYEVLPVDGLNKSKHVARVRVNKYLSTNKLCLAVYKCSLIDISCTTGYHISGFMK